jgi:hypothetical protein
MVETFRELCYSVSGRIIPYCIDGGYLNVSLVSGRDTGYKARVCETDIIKKKGKKKESKKL